MLFARIYSIIKDSCLETNGKRRVNFILNKKLKFYTKEGLKIIGMIGIAFGFISGMLCVKYKPVYAVTIGNENVGYIDNKEEFEQKIDDFIINYSSKNVDSVELKELPTYELKFVDKKEQINEKEIIIAMQKDVIITYKYYDILIDDEVIASVDKKEEAENLVNELKSAHEDLNISISEKITKNIEDINTSEIEVAKSKITSIVEEKENTIADVEGIKIACLPVSGTITSRYAESSSIRSSRHTGLDIAAPSGTDIQVVSNGTVTCASYSGAYGNLVKVDHGNGVETWYAHTSKMYVEVGQEVKSGDIIAAVGSTGSFQIYGTTNFKDFSIEAGDEVTVEGPKKLYNGSVEIENGTIISVTKSLIKVDSVMVAGVKDAAIPSDGGDAEIYITTKTGSVEAEIPAEYKEWLSLKSIKVVGDETVVTVHAAKNEAAARSAELVFTTVKDGDKYKGKAKVTQEGATGTRELPFTVEEAIAFAKANADGSVKEVYIKGIVSKVEKAYNADKGTAVFWISSDGEYHEKDYTKDFEVYSAKTLGNQAWVEGNHQVTVGQEVLVCAKVKVYTDKNGNKTPQTDGGYVCYFANYGDGTAENPFDAIAAIKAVNEGSTAEVYIAGKISKVQNQFNADKGTANFWISPDGTHVDKNYATEFEGYKIKYFGNVKWVEGNKTLNVGDFVVFKGKLTKFKDTCETSEGYLISINGATE